MCYEAMQRTDLIKHSCADTWIIVKGEKLDIGEEDVFVLHIMHLHTYGLESISPVRFILYTSAGKQSIL